MPPTLVLRRPKRDEEGEFLRAHRATTPEVPYFLHYYEEGMSFIRYLEVLGSTTFSSESAATLATSSSPNSGVRATPQPSFAWRLSSPATSLDTTACW
jgi:hypothetical protein